MNESNAPRGSEWDDVVELLHRLSHVMTSRMHYPEHHPAILRAVELATDGMTRVLKQLPEIVVTLDAGEFVICDRPMPDLRANLTVLGDAMERHGIECMVLLRGITADECERLGSALVLPADAPGRVRELAQQQLVHVLLRFADVRTHDETQAREVHAAAFLPAVQAVLDHVLDAFAHDRLADLATIRVLARRIVSACAGRSYTLLTRCYVPGADDQAAHATNVAMMTASMAMAGRFPDHDVVEVTAAALLHDVGTLLSPGAARGLPEPILDEPQRGVFRHHPVTGAWALVATGCPPLWVSVALEHHRGLDERGYPALDAGEPPHELVRTVSLASFFDRKRTLLDGRIDDPDEAIRQASRLERSYFGPPLVTRFVRTLGIYPPGTIVELTDRSSAVVTYASVHDPVRPQVKLLTGPSAGRHVDLQRRHVVEERHELSIARAILPPLAVRDPHEEHPMASAGDGGDGEGELLARLGGGAAVPELARAPESGAPLDHRAGFLLTFVDGMSSVDDLLDGTGLPRLEVLRLLDELVRSGVLRLR